MKKRGIIKQLQRITLYLFCISIFAEVITAPNPVSDMPHYDNGMPNAVNSSKSNDAHTMWNKDRSMIFLVDINNATKDELVLLPGIGDVLAKRIIEHRSRFPFRRKEDLMFVRGIGKGRYGKIEEYIFVGRIDRESR